ncbi:LysR family transcriptional regulator [Pusillimonas sp. ANT_WB101]|nr:LysR family transcriptional regulator [Pusillimonas sp. ANT_WB101]
MRQLRLLISLHELGTVQKAADAVGLSQPDATKALN